MSMSASSTCFGPGKPLRLQIERDQLSSMIFWGPPGVGKTTLARLIARLTRADFVPFSAVLSGVKEIKAVMADAEKQPPSRTADTVSSSMKFIASTRRSRTRFFRMWNAATLFSLARRRRIPPSK